MGIFKRQEPPLAIDRRQSLNSIPMLHDNVQKDETPRNLIALKVQVKRGNGFLDRFRPSETLHRYELDEFGTFVVRQIDQQTRVIEIIERFEQHFHMSHRESELGVVAFLKMLMKRNLISFVVKRG
jgi:hypothetical protein